MKQIITILFYLFIFNTGVSQTKQTVKPTLEYLKMVKELGKEAWYVADNESDDFFIDKISKDKYKIKTSNGNAILSLNKDGYFQGKLNGKNIKIYRKEDGGIMFSGKAYHQDGC